MSAYSLAAAAKQPQLLDPLRSEAQPLVSLNARRISRAEAARLLNCQHVAIVVLTEELILLTDVECRAREPHYLNLLATKLWYTYCPQGAGLNRIDGPAILCHCSQFA